MSPFVRCFMQYRVRAWVGVLVLGLGLRSLAAQSPEPSSIHSKPAPFTPKGPVLLARTPVAPFGAEGSAIFLSGFGSTNRPAMLSLNLRGFSPGHYLVGIVRASDRTFEPLAKFAIIDPTAGPDRDATLNTKTTSNAQQTELLVSQHVVSLAMLDDPTDVAKWVVADALGNYLLVADMKPGR